jgi:ribonuclease P protein component
VAAGNSIGSNRLGLAAGRSLGSASCRNRAKRLLREVFRRNKFEGSLDLILIPKAEMADRTFAEVEREYRARLRRLASRRQPDLRVPRRPPTD